MLSLMMSIVLAASSGGDSDRAEDVLSLIETMEALQQPVEDFRCEFEGTIRYRGGAAESQNVGEDGLQESFSGVFIWKRGGDTHSESLHRRAADGVIARESLVVRMREHQAEQYHRLNDAPLGYAVIKNPTEVNAWLGTPLGRIFLIDKIKQDAADEGLELSVSDGQIEGRALKVLRVAFKGVPNSLVMRYWIDLRRNGHVLRQESYFPGTGELWGRWDVKLASFKLGAATVWMPVAGDHVGYVGEVDNKPAVTKEPTRLESIYVVGGTMEFNKHPGREVFTIKYRPGTPISDNLRKLEYQFGQQKVGLKPTKGEVERMLSDQIAKAEEQKSELVVASPSQGFDWTPWIAWGFGAAALISSVAWWLQRRSH